MPAHRHWVLQLSLRLPKAGNEEATAGSPEQALQGSSLVGLHGTCHKAANGAGGGLQSPIPPTSAGNTPGMLPHAETQGSSCPLLWLMGEDKLFHSLDLQVCMWPPSVWKQGRSLRRGSLSVGSCHLGTKRHCEPQPRLSPAPSLSCLGLTGGPWLWLSTAEWSCSWCSWARSACWLPRTFRSSWARRSVSS